eukprot:CAMPEP_0167775798 /NCGR_PEP_ID=MMETSP0111_2-20121227/2760_1 /TAXON_ID=91324 /ORGANISM="Lotharella globosa, Strain CCCM811" /LENGTH=650 /DNA_ID=CAMNT_0007665755 /DNA_START=81 /DNA_END=2033 /DNA_ORIENTATION=+
MEEEKILLGQMRDMGYYYSGGEDYMTREQFITWLVRICNVPKEDRHISWWRYICYAHLNREFDRNPRACMDLTLPVEDFAEFVLARKQRKKMLDNFERVKRKDKLRKSGKFSPRSRLAPEPKPKPKSSPPVEVSDEKKTTADADEEDDVEEEPETTQPASEVEAKEKAEEEQKKKQEDLKHMANPLDLVHDTLAEKEKIEAIEENDDDQKDERESVEVKEEDPGKIPVKEKPKAAAAPEDGARTEGSGTPHRKTAGRSASMKGELVARVLFTVMFDDPTSDTGLKKIKSDEFHKIKLEKLAEHIGFKGSFKDAVDSVLKMDKDVISFEELVGAFVDVDVSDEQSVLVGKQIVKAIKGTKLVVMLSAHEIIPAKKPVIFIMQNGVEQLEFGTFGKELTVEMKLDGEEGIDLQSDFTFQLASDENIDDTIAEGDLKVVGLLGAAPDQEVPILDPDGMQHSAILIHHVYAPGAVDYLLKEAKPKPKLNKTHVTHKSTVELMKEGADLKTDELDLPDRFSRVDKKKEHSTFGGYATKYLRLYNFVIYYAQHKKDIEGDAIKKIQSEFLGGVAVPAEKHKISKHVTAIHVATVAVTPSSTQKGFTLIANEGRGKSRNFTFEPCKGSRPLYADWSDDIAKHKEAWEKLTEEEKQGQ